VSQPTVRVVGLGPGDLSLVTRRTLQLIEDAPVVRLRTRVHPAAGALIDVQSYDQWYEEADSFESLYARIVDDLVSLARSSPNGEVVYVVPGSPVVAELTVELLRKNADVRTICEPAVSVIDVACAALGRDPMSSGLRMVDALASSEPLRGPGPLLVLQAYAPEVLAIIADRLPPATIVTVLHHLGLSDQVIVELAASELATFDGADHLTSLWIEGLRTAGEATDDLVSFMRRLRAECPWDQEQTHASLTRHLLEEAYEALDALETFVRADEHGEPSDEAAAHVEEELGDLLFQIVFHAELGDEEGRFNLATIVDAVRDKLTYRHPHVFGDVVVSGSNDVASRWEVLKQAEKGRDSVTDGIAWQLPALTLYAKLLRKAALVAPHPVTGEVARDNAINSLRALSFSGDGASDAESSSDVALEWGDALTSILDAAQWAGVDLEGVLRNRAQHLRDEIRNIEERSKR
jgi:tetrapyrrole methylase family protein/MazG family protein